MGVEPGHLKLEALRSQLAAACCSPRAAANRTDLVYIIVKYIGQVDRI